jgi:hypothetical protein
MRSLPRVCCCVLAIVTGLFLAGTAAADDPPQTPDATAPPLPGCPAWLADYRFPQEQFTFVRIKFTSQLDPLLRRARGQDRGSRVPADWGRWATDYPDAEANLAAQLQRHTSLKVDPEGKVLRLTDPELSKFPFIYLVEPGGLVLNDEEVTALRAYLLEGGFLMLDDFWGEDEWKQFAAQIKRVFPDREFQDLPLEHKIFHCVFDLKKKPQVPSIAVALAGRTTERFDAQTPHYRALLDDDGRMMLLACHNTDLADGWERESENTWYYREFAVKQAYPMGINIVFFALTQ